MIQAKKKAWNEKRVNKEWKKEREESHLLVCYQEDMTGYSTDECLMATPLGRRPFFLKVEEVSSLRSRPRAVLYFAASKAPEGHSHLCRSPAHGRRRRWAALQGEKGRRSQPPPPPAASHLLFRWKPPARVLHPLEVLEFDPDVLDVELEQVPEVGQVLRGRLGVGGGVLRGQT